VSARDRFTDLNGTERTQADLRVPTYSRLPVPTQCGA
jgi:hypothetical protein